MRDRTRRRGIRQGAADVRGARPRLTPRGMKSIGKSPRGARRGFLRQSDFVLGRVSPSRSAVPAYGWAVPVQRPFLPEIEVSHQQDPDVEEHLHEPEPMQLAKNVGPRIEEDSFHIKQNKDHRDQIEFYGKRFASVTGRSDAALVRLRFYFGWPSPTHQR